MYKVFKIFSFILLIGILFLFLGNLVNDFVGRPFWTITKIIYLGFDNNFSAWYSSIVLFWSALLWFFLFFNLKSRLSFFESLVFALFVLLLFFMSADEVSQFHETFGGLLSKYLGISGKGFAKHTSWVYSLGPIIFSLFLFFMWNFWKIFNFYFFTQKRYFYVLICGFILIFIGGVCLETSINFLNHDELQFIWDLEVIFEEIFEMFGSWLLGYSALNLLNEYL